MKKPDRLIIDSARAVCVYNRRNGTHEGERERPVSVFTSRGERLSRDRLDGFLKNPVRRQACARVYSRIAKKGLAAAAGLVLFSRRLLFFYTYPTFCPRTYGSPVCSFCRSRILPFFFFLRGRGLELCRIVVLYMSREVVGLVTRYAD